MCYGIWQSGWSRSAAIMPHPSRVMATCNRQTAELLDEPLGTCQDTDVAFFTDAVHGALNSTSMVLCKGKPVTCKACCSPSSTVWPTSAGLMQCRAGAACCRRPEMAASCSFSPAAKACMTRSPYADLELAPWRPAFLTLFANACNLQSNNHPNTSSVSMPGNPVYHLVVLVSMCLSDCVEQ